MTAGQGFSGVEGQLTIRNELDIFVSGTNSELNQEHFSERPRFMYAFEDFLGNEIWSQCCPPSVHVNIVNEL